MKETTGVEYQADVLGIQVQQAQQEAEIRNAAIRQAERQAKMDAWGDAEGMAYRKALHDKGALESLWALRDAGQCVIPFPIPPEHLLPKECRGQQPSTIRKMLWGYPEWRERIDAHAKAAQGGQDTKAKMMEKHPEIFGIDYVKLRESLKVRFGDEHRVRDGHRLNVHAADGFFANTTPTGAAAEEAAKPGFVARVLAGIWRR